MTSSSLNTSLPNDASIHYVIYGAGGIGATIGARLHRAGFRVTLIARGEHGRCPARARAALRSTRLR